MSKAKKVRGAKKKRMVQQDEDWALKLRERVKNDLELDTAGLSKDDFAGLTFEEALQKLLNNEQEPKKSQSDT